MTSFNAVGVTERLRPSAPAVLTIITASHANPTGLRALGRVVLPQLSATLHWTVKDSGYSTEASAWAGAVRSPFFSFISSQDCGIYDALNQALAQVDSTFYLVVGADDELYPEALVQIIRLLSEETGFFSSADIVTFPIHAGKGTRRRRPFWPVWISNAGITTSHSVGTVIRRSLHDRLGAYNERYEILGDALFFRLSHLSRVKFLHADTPVIGRFGLDGISSRQAGRRIIEAYSYMCESGSPRILQLLLLTVRMLRHLPKSLIGRKSA